MKKGKARARTGAKGVTRLAVESVETPPQAGPVSAQRIERRAYELYLLRGQGQGSAIEDWLQAERELSRTNPRPLPKG